MLFVNIKYCEPKQKAKMLQYKETTKVQTKKCTIQKKPHKTRSVSKKCTNTGDLYSYDCAVM